ncbi:MAG TPA: hypothetical protein VHA37_09760 [Candidatus Saccharimonadales bacterium]|nr:hypothetical protein [Candidatus Saccharimonadales bacterium]
MQYPDQIEPVSLMPDRLAAADFSASEIADIVGDDELSQGAARDSFNWIAAYLCEEIGFLENEVVDWFRAEKTGLEGDSPLSIWPTEDGPVRIFEYAQEVKEQVDEDLALEPEEHWSKRSHRLGNHALEVVRKGFWTAGINVGPPLLTSHTTSHAIYNPAKGRALTARWKGNNELEDWRITIQDGSRTASYFVVRYFPPQGEPFILQTGIGRSFTETARHHAETLDIDTDINGRPPSIGEVASFVVPLAAEVKNKSLELIQ